VLVLFRTMNLTLALNVPVQVHGSLTIVPVPTISTSLAVQGRLLKSFAAAFRLRPNTRATTNMTVIIHFL
jgi:hypothetical protein